jgi:hypothetical protein
MMLDILLSHLGYAGVNTPEGRQGWLPSASIGPIE